jgi:hypothetical protein
VRQVICLRHSKSLQVSCAQEENPRTGHTSVGLQKVVLTTYIRAFGDLSVEVSDVGMAQSSAWNLKEMFTLAL